MIYNIIKLKYIINKTVKDGEYMIFNINAALLDALVLAIVKKEDTYGYEITRVLKNELDVSESTLYPVLRRLQKDDCLEIYDKE